MTDTDKIIDELEDITNDYKGVNVEKIENLYLQATRVTSKGLSNVSVQTTPRNATREDILIMLAELSKNYDECNRKLKEIYHKVIDRDLKIYIEKKYFHLSNAKLEEKWGIGRRQIQKICKKIEKNRQSSPWVRGQVLEYD